MTCDWPVGILAEGRSRLCEEPRYGLSGNSVVGERLFRVIAQSSTGRSCIAFTHPFVGEVLSYRMPYLFVKRAAPIHTWVL